MHKERCKAIELFAKVRAEALRLRQQLDYYESYEPYSFPTSAAWSQEGAGLGGLVEGSGVGAGGGGRGGGGVTAPVCCLAQARLQREMHAHSFAQTSIVQSGSEQESKLDALRNLCLETNDRWAKVHDDNCLKLARLKAWWRDRQVMEQAAMHERGTHEPSALETDSDFTTTAEKEKGGEWPRGSTNIHGGGGSGRSGGTIGSTSNASAQQATRGSSAGPGVGMSVGVASGRTSGVYLLDSDFEPAEAVVLEDIDKLRAHLTSKRKGLLKLG